MHTLCTRVYDGVQTPAELERFNRLLDRSAPARRFYLGYVRLHCNLMTSAGKDQSERVDALRRYVADSGQSMAEQAVERDLEASSVETAIPRAGLGWQRTALAVAASLFVLATAGLLMRNGTPTTTVKNDAGDLTPTAPPARSDASPPAARLSYVSQGVRRNGAEHPLRPSTTVAAGDLLSLPRGELELTYASGTRLLLAGPAEFAVAEAGGRLLSGGLVASVTEAGHGFTIDTPNGKIIDRGTEFGVAVDDFGVSEVSVFQGTVEAYPKEEGATVQRKIDLTKGRGLQWDKKSLISLNANLLSFASSVFYAAPGQPAVSDDQAIRDEFNQPRLDSQTWATLGAVEATEGGLRLTGNADTEFSPCLVTTQQFDPARGAITVTCDFRFEGEGPLEEAVFAVLTRSQSERGISLPPWRGTLAACTRCSFESSDDKGTPAGTLRAGVKMESSRELMSISQRDFLPPSVDTPYRAVVRDDGIHLTCTISLRDDASQSSTIRCRSLFRGGKNHVAFEGGRNGVTLIEKIEITQAIRDTPPSSYDSFVRLVRGTDTPTPGERQLLDSLAPADATLVCEDDFDDGTLDENLWQFLGEVRERDGSLHLGVPTEGGTIDTWKPRPYLLTRQDFDPQDGAVTVIGRVRFAENFLTGFGATFSVMIRAEASYGQGPEWEQSVLSRGVRATFWPAAWDQGRRFEVHERAASDRLTLLATQGAEVDPRQRSYLFRLIDEGRSIELTIIDPNHPSVPVSITTAEASLPTQGPLAFESCWGSPLVLDDVRVYQANR